MFFAAVPAVFTVDLRAVAQRGRELHLTREAPNAGCGLDRPVGGVPFSENVVTLDTLAGWHAAVAHRDARALDTLLADDVVFHSPVVHTPQVGKALATRYLTAAFHVFFNETFRYVRVISGAQDAVLEFDVTIDGVVVNGVDMIRWNETGQIVDFTVMIRPLKALHLIHEKMAAMLQVNAPRGATA